MSGESNDLTDAGVAPTATLPSMIAYRDPYEDASIIRTRRRATLRMAARRAGVALLAMLSVVVIGAAFLDWYYREATHHYTLSDDVVERMLERYGANSIVPDAHFHIGQEIEGGHFGPHTFFVFDLPVAAATELPSSLKAWADRSGGAYAFRDDGKPADVVGALRVDMQRSRPPGGLRR